MKKEMILFVVLFVLGCGINVTAQTKASIGIKLDVGSSDIKLSKVTGGEHSFKPAATLGGFTRIDFNEHFALQPELVFNYTESNVRIAGEKTKFKYAGVELPVYAIGKIKAGPGTLLLGVGPHIGYGFSIDSKIENLHHNSTYKNVIELDHWYLGGGVQAGYEFQNRISLTGTYKMGYDLRSSSHSADIKTHTVALGVSYRFW